MLLLLVTIYTVTHIALQTNKNNVALPLSQRWFMGFLLPVWPAGLEMTSNSPQIYSFCLKPCPKWGLFLKPQSVCGIRCLSFIFPHCALSPHSHPSPLFSDLPTSAVFFSPIITIFMSAQSRSGSESIKQSAKFTIPLPSLKAKGISRPIFFPPFPIFDPNGAHPCMGGYGIVHQTNSFPVALLPPKRCPHLIHCLLLPPRLSRECLGKLNHALEALAGPAC